MSTSCQSCGMPLAADAAQVVYCGFCVDEAGRLRPKEQVQTGIARWLEGFAPEGTGADFMERAGHYMKAMPAWAEK